MKASLSRNPPLSSSFYRPHTAQSPEQQQQLHPTQQKATTPSTNVMTRQSTASNPNSSGTYTALKQQQSPPQQEAKQVARQLSFTVKILPKGLCSCERVVQILQSLDYNREFIKSSDLDLANSIIHTANQRVFNFGRLKIVPNESQINDLIAALHALKNYPAPPMALKVFKLISPCSLQVQQAHIVNLPKGQ